MTAYRARLTESDIRRLIKSDLEDERAAAAYKLCRNMERMALDDVEREAAQKILLVLAADAAELVRRAVAVTLKASDIMPREAARRLAGDVDSVALPIINSCPAFTDDDLIEIVRAGTALRQVAVASRPCVPRDVAAVLAAEGRREAVVALAANDNADLSEGALGVALDRFSEARDVVSALAYRQVLPVSITERLIALASDSVREHLIVHHAVAAEVAVQLANFARERATVDLVDQARMADDLSAFVAGLNKRRALTPSLLLRALARGQIGLFEHALAELAGAPHHRAWLMVHDAGPLGLKAIYDRAGMPPRLFQAFRAGVDTWRALQAEGGDTGSAAFRQRMLERFLSQRPDAAREDLAYLLERLDCSSEENWSRAENAA